MVRRRSVVRVNGGEVAHFRYRDSELGCLRFSRFGGRLGYGVVIFAVLMFLVLEWLDLVTDVWFLVCLCVAGSRGTQLGLPFNLSAVLV
ncbi:hypothetical protein E2542_SST03748 [Spatholobus suberectus]|nr:hypothetical protein E2542_SST03748 [Spatholobus suberectus]